MKRKVKRPHLLRKMLFLDVLSDRRTAPILVYASSIVVVGTVLYHWLEGWSWLDSVYFVVITLTTIGYGDLHPTTSLTKLITIFYGINGIIVLLMMFDVVRKVRGWEIPERAEGSQSQENKAD